MQGLEFYVGGYAQPEEKGVLKCAFDGERFEILDSNDELHNPSWLLPHPEKPLLYAVEELSPEGELAVLAAVNGHLKVLHRASTRGADPCHIAMSPDKRHLFVSNYTGGSLAVYELDGDGFPARMTDFILHRMEGLRVGNPVRQEAPHMHFSLCDGKYIYVNDLGLNKVFIYGWDFEKGKLIDHGKALEFPAGSGPRHLAFSADGRFLYVLCELNATLHVFRRDGDADWQRVQVVSTISEDWNDFERFTWSCAAAIHFADRHTLYASTRGHNSLACFEVGEDGLLGNRQIISAMGETPRDFLTVGDLLLVANQDSDSVQLFKRINRNYRITDVSMKAKHPTCLCIIKQK